MSSSYSQKGRRPVASETYTMGFEGGGTSERGTRDVIALCNRDRVERLLLVPPVSSAPDI